MKLPSVPLVVLDTETTGFVPRVHHVIEFASVTVRDGKVVDTYEQLFFAEEVPPTVEVLTRIETESLQTMPRFEERRDEVASHIPEDAVIVGQNVSFDIGMLKGEGIDLSERPWIDTSMLASLVFPELESYSLQYVSDVLELDHSPKHRALGDVRATLALLGRCWSRLLELTPSQREQALSIMGKSSEGYRRLFATLPPATKKKSPSWLKAPPPEPPLPVPSSTTSTLSPGKIGEIQLLEETLEPGFILGLVNQAMKDRGHTHWFAVKNLDAFVRRLPEELLGSKDVRILYPPSHLLDPVAAKRIAEAETLTADEATLALKLAWYDPTTRNDLPLHGGEEPVWRATLACTDASAAYCAQLKDLPSVVFIDHRQMLGFLEEREHPAKEALTDTSHVILDDASMLEDTATKAYGWYVVTKDLRAAAERSEPLTRFLDLFQLWIEKVRSSQDTRVLTLPDLTTPETKGLRERLREIRTSEQFPPQTTVQLSALEKILDSDNLPERFAWIEQRMDGSQGIQSVPERVAILLRDLLYLRYPSTLLIPPGSSERLNEILPDALPCHMQTATDPTHLDISFPITTFEETILTPFPEKMIIILNGKGAIENSYVKYTELLEERGTTLICQGIGGGVGRMRAEFLAAKAPALWLVTPWMFEGLDLPPDTVSRVVLSQLPFDYYSHPILSRRSARYRDGFPEYFFPRLLQRLFRILRTYERFRTPDGDMRIIDDRVRTKGYGKEVVAYLSHFSTEGVKHEEKPKEQPPRKKGKDGKGQMALF